MRAILFDFDGTLADTLPRVERMLPQLARRWRFRAPLDGEIRVLRDLPAGQILSRLGISWWKSPLVLADARRRLSRDQEPILPFPGMVALLHDLDQAGIEWGILTTNGWAVVRRSLRQWGAPEPGWLEAGVGISGKASRIAKVAARFQVPPADLVLVGDEVRDWQAAGEAGCGFVGVGWGYNLPDSLERAGVNQLCVDLGSLRQALGLDPTPVD